MSTRILHCSNSLENYYLCLNEKVAGFVNRGRQPGDIIYMVVRVGKKSVCGARFILDEPTDYKPWPDADNYVNAFTVKDVEYCQPFNVSILSKIGGSSWALKYMQGSKPINDETALSLLDSEFNTHKTESLVILEPDANLKEAMPNEGHPALFEDISPVVEDEKEMEKLIKEIPGIKVNIMGTFQTVHFSNETDKIKGLEALVNENFYSLFPQFPEAKTLLIPENRLFKTKGFKVDGNNVQGIRTIPDALLIVHDRKQKNCFQINLIEYECYGERKTRETDKSNYLNSNVIPQLMRFASAFSIITDDQTRFNTVKLWVDKIIDYLNKDEGQSNKMIGWIKDMFPDIKERSIEREIEKQLMESFKTNLRVLLIIDELSAEQKSTIKNVVSSFKLANGENNVQFTGYVVRLVQKINIMNNESEFALTVQ